MTPKELNFSVITPSAGKRPNALRQAISSVAAALAHAKREHPGVTLEHLVGYDGVKGPRFVAPNHVRCFDLPKTGNFGNFVRQALIKAARGTWLLFVDDDNALLPGALSAYLRHPEADMIIARVDTSRAFADTPVLPRGKDSLSLVRQGNVDPLCLCVRRELVLDRCGGWQPDGGYESDYRNILRYARRARALAVIDDLVGVYDAGRGLDHKGLNPRQAQLAS